MSRRGRAGGHVLVGVAFMAMLCAACGLTVQAADLFVITRTGQGSKLTLLVNDSGTIRCNGGPPRSLPAPLLLQARDLATQLDNDAKAGLRIPPTRVSVYLFRVRLQDGTITFADTSAALHHELAQIELFTLQAAQSACPSSH